MNQQYKKILFRGLFGICAIAFTFFIWETYIPRSFSQAPNIIYTIKKGKGSNEIARELKNQGIIKQAWFFRLYTLGSGSYKKLQAGTYEVSPSLSLSQIVKKFTSGDVAKHTITIIEGWNIKDIGQYLEDTKISNAQEFLQATKMDWSQEFGFLADKPKSMDFEGYLFPDTYQLDLGATPPIIIKTALANFDTKLTPQLKKEITAQKKSVFQIITMASLIEKEVISREDKKIVSGILWKRLHNGMPLQVDATINYITGKHDPGATIKDTTIDSPYNTYKYSGLPLGPICNPGLSSIEAAIYPTPSAFWYYLSEPKEGKTIFSKTLDEHNAAVAKYLR